jgi:hypothetical protein
MTPKKENHHYIPKFYLRQFSYDGNKKQIGIYNTRTGLFLRQAKLKTQACKPYLYGRDNELEDALMEFENIAAVMLRNIIGNKFLPIRESFGHHNLLHFVLLTQLRNPIASSKIDEQLNEMYKSIFSRDIRFKSFFEKYKLSFGEEYMIMMGLKQVEKTLLQCYDLHYKLIVNNTRIPFIICDNPLLKYNQFMESRKWPMGQCGFSSMGLQMFFPLDPQHLLFLYDPTIYKVGDRSKNVIETETEEDINEINRLNLLNCEEVLFFNDAASEYYIRTLHQQSLKFQKANIPFTHRFRTEDMPGEINSSIVMTSISDCRTNMNLSFVRQTKSAKNHTFDDRVLQLRKAYWKLKPYFETMG